MRREKRNEIFSKETSMALKGIAILMLLFHHCYQKEVLFKKYTVIFDPFAREAVILFSKNLKICVSIFAFITGYGLFLSYQNNKTDTGKWMAKRYIKTFSGYWFVWILCAILFQLYDGRFWYTFFKETDFFTGTMNAFLDFTGLANLFQTPTLCKTWWYMSAVIIFILATPVLFRMKNELVLILFAAICFPRALFVRNIRLAYPTGTSPLAFITPFIFGAIFARYGLFDKWIQVGKSIGTKFLKCLIELALIVFFYNMYTYLIHDKYWEFHYGFYPVLVILFLVEFVLQVKVVRKILYFFGYYSMNMYFIHSFYLSIYMPDFVYSFKNFLLIAAVLLVLSLATSILIELVKKLIRFDKLVDCIVCRL